MAEEKKYEITISDLSAYIGAAAFEILPEDAKEEDVDKYAMVAAGITDRVAKHLDGSDPLPEDHVALAKEMGQFINELGVVCEKIVQAVMEEQRWKAFQDTTIGRQLRQMIQNLPRFVIAVASTYGKVSRYIQI